jgi:type IVB pilus formation R64 PilN family outer membrane protein
MKNMQLKAITAAIALTMLGGCATTQNAESTLKADEKFGQKSFDGARVKSTAASQDPSRSLNANFGKVQRNWVNPNPLQKSELAEERSKLPDFFKNTQANKVVLTFPGKVSLVEIMSELQRSNRVVFDVAQDVYNSSTGLGTIVKSDGTGAATTAGGSEVKDNSIGTNGAIPIYVNDFVFRGSLEEALDLLASKANISWKWNGSRVQVFRFETKTYNIAALSGVTRSGNSVSIQSDSGGTEGAGKTNTGITRESELNTWSEVRGYLASMLSPNGTVSFMESAGIVTVRDVPAVQRSVSKAVKELNGIIGQQVFLDVNVYSVVINDEDNYALNWNLAWQSLSQNFNLNLANSPTAIAGATNLTANVINGPFTGSTVMMKALSTLGKTSVVNQFSTSTLNNQTTPIGNNRKISYIKSVSSTPSTTQGVAPTVTVATDTVAQGIGMSVTPRVQQGSNKVLLEYSLNLNDVENIETISTGSGDSAQTIQLPTTTVKNILQRASLRSGQTLVLSGFKQSSANITKSGIGSASNFLLGGGRGAKNGSQYLIITVTPFLAQDSE